MLEADHLVRRRLTKPNESGLPRFAILDSVSLPLLGLLITNQEALSWLMLSFGRDGTPRTDRCTEGQEIDILLRKRRQA
jgi:hypothetical protein